MKKKILKIVIIVLIVLALVLALYEICIQYDGKLDKSNPMSREEVIELLNKGASCNNYSILWKSGALIGTRKETILQETYIKDNIIKTYLNGKDFTWINYDENERIQFMNYPLVALSNESDFGNPNLQKPRNK